METKPKILDWINYNLKAYGDDPNPITSAEQKVADAVEANQIQKKPLPNRCVLWKIRF